MGMTRVPLLFLLLLHLLAACTAPAPPPATAERDVLRIVDINVWSGLRYDRVLRMGEYETTERRELRYQALLSQLRALEPDVIGVHEANPLPAYVDRLARDLGYDAVQHMGLGGVRAGPVGLPWNLREGDAILARPDLGLHFEGRRRLSGGPVGSFFSFHFSDATQVLAASIGVNGRRLYLFATHWHASPMDLPPVRALLDSIADVRGAGEDARAAALRELEAGAAWRMKEAERMRMFVDDVAGGAPVVLMGDFNATTATPEVRHLLDAGFVDAHALARGDSAAATWDPARNLNIREHYGGPPRPDDPAADDLSEALSVRTRADPGRIDLVLVGPGAALERGEIRVVDARVVLDEVVGGVHASDHFGVMVEVGVEPGGRQRNR